ncbi:MAG: hypothetical protein QNJ74_10500 [Trichodesmium sp. MO_231.B1]|nr:hypothetical protein [Trichodesmium sp. MO_231.B1]
MSTLYTINVTNNSPSEQDFFFFQKPAQYTGGSQVYSNSIYHQVLQPYKISGATLTFQFLQQYYAGVQTQRHNLVVGQASGSITASQPIDLTTEGEETNNTTEMSVDPSLGLKPPTHTDDVQPGAYRIITPTFNANLKKYNAGLAIKNNATGTIVLSNFINAEPNKNLDCQPQLIFYVQTGSYQAGDVIHFTTSSKGAANCDTTAGFTTFNVDYNPDGSWSVTPVLPPTALYFAGVTQLIGNPDENQVNNINIKNEAGTAIISTGYAGELTNPLVVKNLSSPNLISVKSEYQISISGGDYKGYICTAKDNDSATFSK